MLIGDKVPYLYKVHGEQFTVEAEIISLNRNAIEIEFIKPSSTQFAGGFVMRRTLRTAADRARLLDYTVPRPGAPAGNQNAAKEGPKRQLVTLSLKGDDLERVARYLAQQDKLLTTATLRALAYEAIDSLIQ